MTSRRSRSRSAGAARSPELDGAAGLLSEARFARAAGLGMSAVRTARLRGRIVPVRQTRLRSRRRFFYHPRQVSALKRALGITLGDTTGLLNESEFCRVSGFCKIHAYRKRGLIRPVGYAMGHAGLSAFYRPEQVQELKRAMGITLEDTTGLLSDPQVRRMPGFANIHTYRKRGLIKPAGYALNGNYVSAFYRPEEVQRLQRRLGVTLSSTSGLLSEKEFAAASGIRNIAEYRRRGLIKPAGYALNGNYVGAFYRPEQIQELKRKLAITIDDTTKLLTEKEFTKVSGLTAVYIYRRKGLIRPVGRAVNRSTSRPRTAFFYSWRQIAELKRKLGVTLEDTNGLLSEDQVAKLPGLSQIRAYRKEGLIEPLGYAFSGGGAPAGFYHPLQLDRLRRKLELRKTVHRTEKQRR